MRDLTRDVLELFADAQSLGQPDEVAISPYWRRRQKMREYQRAYESKPDVKKRRAAYMRMRRAESPELRAREAKARKRWLSRTGYKSPSGTRHRKTSRKQQKYKSSE